jgi:putative glutamine amidotransferase
MQVMAVAAGGTLDQHTPDLVGHEQHSPGGDTFGEIEVVTDDASALRTILGPAVTVHCHHHQSVRSHPGFEAVAHAQDGTLEAMEAEGARFCLGVQWHPEMGRDQRLFDALVRAAAG